MYSLRCGVAINIVVHLVVVDVEWWMWSGRCGVALNIVVHLVVVDMEW